MKRFSMITMFAILAMIFTTSIVRAEVAPPLLDIYDNEVHKLVTQTENLLLQFGAKAGFPETRPAGMQNASYEELYKLAALRALQAKQLFENSLKKFKFPMKLELGAKYFQKRLEIGANPFESKNGNGKVFKFLCEDFATACDMGLEELRLWKYPEFMAFDNIWFKNIQNAFIPVKAKMLKVEIPAQIDPEAACETWRNAASALMAAGNEAGIASTKVGSGGLANFPAWRLKYAIKYFKAAAKAAVITNWHSHNSDANFWLKACEDLQKEVNQLNLEMEAFLELMQ